MFSLALSRAARVTVTTRSPALAWSSSVTSRFFHASPTAEAKLNVEGLAGMVDLKGKNVLVRVDLNVPLAKVRYFLFLSPGSLP
jgi:hypothetical protein